ncbi:MAG: hypothetical protein M1167_01685 [Chloroflexi bacterium]|nr:hypothetical protein [Chloroflexota bacterium]
MPKSFTQIVIIANIIMGLLMVIPGETEFILLNGQSITVDPFLIYHQPIGNPPIPTVTAPWLNLPTYFLILFLIVNGYFVVKLRSGKADEKMK